MKHRADFVAASKALRQSAQSMLVQARNRHDENPARVGFTCSKKVGNAVARNRAKRRLRAAARSVFATHARAGFDYVLIGRHKETSERPFDQLVSDLRSAVNKLHQKADQ